MKLRPFRFGVLCEQMDTQRAWVTKARQIEDAGYATLLIRDHFISEPFGDQFAPLAALMAAADATTTMTFMLTHHSAIFFFQALLELLPVEWIGRPVMILTFSLRQAFLLQ